MRLCSDARKLNDRLIDDNEAPVGIEKVLQNVRSIGVMSNIDLRSSYWQISLSEESRKYTAFSVNGKCYEFSVPAFGIRTSGASLLSGLESVNSKVSESVLNFVDDFVCILKDFDSYLGDLRSLFQCLLDNNLTLNFDKSFFVIKEVDFLGYRINPKEVSTQPEKLEIIKAYSRPKNAKELKAFFGFVNFYSKFARNYSSTLVPLLGLLKKNAKFVWREEHEVAFKNVKDLFLDTVVLAHPNSDKPYILYTDASKKAIGACLVQIDDEGDERVITFIIRTLKG